MFAESLEILIVALEALHKEALHVSWPKTKIQVFRGLMNETVQSVHLCGKNIEIF